MLFMLWQLRIRQKNGQSKYLWKEKGAFTCCIENVTVEQKLSTIETYSVSMVYSFTMKHGIAEITSHTSSCTQENLLSTKILTPLKQKATVGATLVECKKALMCILKPGNTHNWYAVAVGKNGTVKGHLPWKVSRVCTLFLKKGGHIRCRVTGRQEILSWFTSRKC